MLLWCSLPPDLGDDAISEEIRLIVDRASSPISAYPLCSSCYVAAGRSDRSITNTGKQKERSDCSNNTDIGDGRHQLQQRIF